MDAKIMARVLSRYDSRLVTASEVANKLLYEWVSEPEIDRGFISILESLPDGIKQEFYRLLQSIKEADYQWTPFLLNVRTDSPDLGKYSEKLRRISALLT